MEPRFTAPAVGVAAALIGDEAELSVRKRQGG